MHPKRIGRAGGLAVGLGIGALVAATPWIAAADPLLPFDPNDFAISIDGLTLFQVGSATATSGLGDIAIADGANSQAFAEGGFGDFASADGAFAHVVSGSTIVGATGNNFDSASAVGDHSSAFAGVLGSFDSARAVGLGVESVADKGNFDSASVFGNLTQATTNLTFAGAGGGSNDLAFIVDPFGTLGSEATAGLGGNFDLAAALADNLNAIATGSDFLFHILPFF